MIALNTVVTYDLNSLPDYVQYTNKIKQQYCAKYKNCEYIFKSVNTLYNTDYLYKFSMCKDLIQSNKYTWIVVMDLDAVPCNFNIDFQSWLNQQQKKIIIGKDYNGINAGVVAIPCIDKSILFLDKMFQLGKTKNYNWDQDIIIELIKTEYKDFYLQPDKNFGFNNYINRYSKNVNEFVFGKSFILHIPNPDGMNTPRLQNFKKIYDKIQKENIEIKYRTPIIGGRFGNILYGLLNNYINSIKDNKKYIYVNSKKYSNNLISQQIINAFNLQNIYNTNINNDIKDEQIQFIKQNPKSACFAGFNIDYSEDQLNTFIQDIFLSTNIFKNTKLINDKIALNIRGGDYLSDNNINNYKFNFEKYLNIVFSYFKDKNINDLDIYTDDINYAKTFLNIFKKYNFNIIFKENTTALNDFINLSLYKNKILWNSTFSYWTGYISNVLFKDNYKEIFVPENHVKWFNSGKAWQINPKWNIIKEL